MASLLHLLSDVGSVAHIVLLMSIVAALGLGLGSLRVRGVGLGIAGILFAGLFIGHFTGNHQQARRAGLHRQVEAARAAGQQGLIASRQRDLEQFDQRIDAQHHILEFAREFGLILFVYAIGVQVGPGFISSLRRHGLPLNLMAAAVVILGAVTTVLIARTARLPMPVAVGMFSGATTNTPSLAAAQQALKDRGADEAVRNLPSLSYALAYPFGIVGIILTMLLLKWGFRMDLSAEAAALAASQDRAPPVARMNIEVTNPNLDGLSIGRLPFLRDQGVVISRVLHGGKLQLAQPQTIVHAGDVLLAVGPQERLDELRLVVGRKAEIDLLALPSNITSRRIVVTRRSALGKTVAELNLRQRFGVAVTRVSRAEVELPATGVPLQFADNLVVVGELEDIQAAARELGDSVKKLNDPQIIPMFVGIALGVLLGSWSLHLPALPAPVKLGLAGGPLVIALVLSRLGHLGPLVWYMPISANFVLREVGIALFLASVGLMSGDRFLDTLGGSGLQWMGLAALITLLPLLLVGTVARLFYRVNYLSLCGLLAGSMTDPPALAFASSITGSEAPSVSYATVYPLVMLLRVLCAQVLVLAFM